MRIVAFDTATALTAVAIQDIDSDARVCLLQHLDLSAVDDPPAGQRPRHAQRLLALIEQLFDQGDTGWEEVDRIAVGVGPGTFTGLRIGIATAQALSASAAKPLVGVSTLRGLALAIHDLHPDHAKLAVIDARRNEAFLAGWEPGADPLEVDPALGPLVARADDLTTLVSSFSPGVVAGGDGAVRFAPQLAHGGALVPEADWPQHRVSARYHCRLAAVAPGGSVIAPGRTVAPMYLRVPDAELSGG
ncbi:MAG: tRNA (adenosine(37)-N6)-threonylcarbamoyltransferase complex dimerization subunit type 1 TsaB [Solirubrobacteraceae bacterium]